MKVFLSLFIILTFAFVGWKLSPNELKDLFREAIRKVSLPVIAALLITILVLSAAMTFNVKVI